MQQMLYDDWPYAVTYYYDNLVAYRTDKFEGFIPQPDPNGSYLFQYGTWTYENLKPIASGRAVQWPVARAHRRHRGSRRGPRWSGASYCCDGVAPGRPTTGSD